MDVRGSKNVGLVEKVLCFMLCLKRSIQAELKGRKVLGMLIVLGCVLIVWLLGSYLQVICNNINPDAAAAGYISKYNLFKVLFL